jgi:hypothetical protein
MKAEAQQKVPSVARWLFPSIKDVLFLAYLFVPIFLNQSGVLYDGDTGWHIRNGEHILQTRTWPNSDYFSYTNFGKPWFAWEWLADVVLALINKYAGLNGIVVWANLIFALTFTLLFRWMIRRGGNIFICLVYTALSGFASAVHWLARPHLFSMLLVLIWYILLEHIQHQGTTASQIPKTMTWLAPSIILVWTNLHGGFVVGLILLLVYALGNYLTSLTTRLPDVQKQCRSLSWYFAKLSLICLTATLINPYGIFVHKHIFDAYLHSQYLVDRVTEFASPNFHTTVVKFFEFILVSSLVILGISYKKLTFIEVGIIVFWTHMALFSVRHVPLYTLMISPILVRHFTDYFKKIEHGVELPPWIANMVRRFNTYSGNILVLEMRFKGYIYSSVISLILIGISLNQGYWWGNQVLKCEFDDKQFPIKASEYIGTNAFAGNMFTTDYWGGYMIYRFHPQLKVFFDGRSDMYDRDFIREYQSLVNLEYSWKGILDKYQVRWILLPVNYGLAAALKELPKWKVVYDDHIAIIFVRKVE